MVMAAFGLAVELALPVPELDPLPPLPDDLLPAGPSLRVELAAPDELDAAWTGRREAPEIRHAVVDGSAWTAERGLDGDTRMDHPLARFHLDPGARLLRCAPADPDHPAWRRLLLDTALVTASLVRGRDALHAGAVVKGGDAIAIAGASGAGKTTTMLELLRRGARFLTDDVTVLDAGEPGVRALPGAPVVNLPDTEARTDLAERLHRFDGEWWARIREPHLAAAPVRAVVVLERGPAPISRLREPAAPLLQHALQSGADSARRAARFALLARLSEQADVIRAGVDRSRPVGELVDELVQALRTA